MPCRDRAHEGPVTWHVGLLREEGKGPEGARVTLVFGALGPVLRGGIRAQGPSAEGDRTTATLRPRQDPPTPALKSARFSLPVYFGGRKLLGAALAASRPRFGPVSAILVRRAGSAFVSAMPGRQACLQPSYLSLRMPPLSTSAHISTFPLRRVGSRTTRVRAGEHQGPRTAHGGNLGGSSMPLSRTTAHHIVN